MKLCSYTYHTDVHLLLVLKFTILLILQNFAVSPFSHGNSLFPPGLCIPLWGVGYSPQRNSVKKKASQQLSLNLISMFQHQNSQISYQNKVFLVFLKVLIARYQVFLDNGLLTKRSSQYQPAKAGEGQGYVIAKYLLEAVHPT